MSNKKISELNATNAPADADVFPIVQGGETKKVSFADIKANIPSGGGGDFIGCRVIHSGDVSVANNSFVTIAFTIEEFDTDNMHDNSTDNTHITFTTAGYYSFGYGFQGASSEVGNMGAIIKNQSGVVLASTRIHVVSDGVCEGQVTGISYFYAGDYIVACALQQTGATQTYYTNTSYSNRFWAYKIG